MDYNKKLYIGLDVGTDSVGWAATDEDFKLWRLKGKTAWGARLFLAGENAQARRGFRTAGRRLARRKERIRLLNTLFDPLISPKDPTFLIRLENSALQDSDKNPKAIAECPLFINRKEEKEFYKAYPTIWHLRLALLNNDDKAYSDIRYLYLAVHHMIKYRGNFLREGDIQVGKFDNSVLDNFNEYMLNKHKEFVGEDDEDDLTSSEILPQANYAEFIDAVTDRTLGKREKQSKILKLMSDIPSELKAFCGMFASLCVGGSYSISKLNVKGEEDKYEKFDIVFDNSFDEKEDRIKDILGDDYTLVELAKSISDFRDLKDILGGSDSLSKAFVNIYESHKAELRALKDICKNIDSVKNWKDADSIYVKLFNDKDSDLNYAAFVHNKSNKSRCKIEDFDKAIVKLIDPYADVLTLENKRNWAQLKTLAEQNHLLQTIAIRSTSIIPEQVHKKELIKALDNAIARNINGIAEIKDKVISIFEYKIPYYCGPMTTRSSYSNVHFKSANYEKVLPWNWKNLIDLDETKKQFMEGLKNKCTYLKGCDVVPVQSVLFQDYDAWNKLNNLSLTGDRRKLTKEETAELFDFVSHRNKSTLKDIQKHIKTKYCVKGMDVEVIGWNPNDFIDMSCRVALSNVFDLSNRYKEDYVKCEEALYYKAIFTDSPKDAEAYLTDKLGLNANQLKALSKIHSKGWAPFSKEFLMLRGMDSDGVIQNETIMDHLEACDGNLMQILHDERFNYLKVIDEKNAELFAGETDKQRVAKLIDEMPPATRRPVIQAIRIVNEVVKIAKREGRGPDVIAIEVTRENNNSEKKKAAAAEAASRKKNIEAFLKNLGSESDAQVKGELANLDDEKRLRGKHLYLYFLQNGKDAYDGEPIDINDVLNGNRYDTDHIIPQSFLKDDSIDNLVLVKREVNQARKNKYPLDAAIVERMKPWWAKLRKAKGMSDKKYNNLIRRTPLTEEELSAFVSAQINVVNRSNVVIRDALKILYPNAKLIFSKAQYASQIRRDLSIPKLRDLNDTHHAVDAYLNVVSGVKLTDRFGDLRVIKAMANKTEADDSRTLNMERYLNRQLINEGGILTELGALINKNSLRHDFLLTYRFIYQDSAFYKQTIYPKDDSGSLIKAHDNLDPSKYGGYKSMSVETHVIATVKGKKKTTRYLLGLPHILAEKRKAGKDITEEAIKLVKAKPNEEVTIDLDNFLPLCVTVKKDGFEYLLMSSNQDQVKLFPFSPVYLTRDSAKYLYDLRKLVERRPDLAKEKEATYSTDKDGVHKLTFNSDKSKFVVSELLELSSLNKFSYCPMIHDMSAEDCKIDVLATIDEKTLGEQLQIIRNIACTFTRRSMEISKKYFSKSRGVVLQDDLTIVSKSITGLYEKETKL